MVHIIYKSFAKNYNFITCYIAISAPAIIANFGNKSHTRCKRT